MHFVEELFMPLSFFTSLSLCFCGSCLFGMFCLSALQSCLWFTDVVGRPGTADTLGCTRLRSAWIQSFVITSNRLVSFTVRKLFLLHCSRYCWKQTAVCMPCTLSTVHGVEMVGALWSLFWADVQHDARKCLCFALAICTASQPTVL